MSERPCLVIQADDLTGAADAAVGFAEAGERTVVVPWSRRAELSDRLDATVGRLAPRCLALDTASRDEDARESRRRAAATAHWAAGCGVESIYKKVDSVLRGQPGAELRGVLEGLGTRAPRLVVVAPAFPALGRTTVGGRQLAHGRPVAGEADVARRFGAGSFEVARVSVEQLRGGVPALAEMLDNGPRLAVVDAELESDLDLLVAAIERLVAPPLLVGSGGLAAAVAAARGRRDDARAGAELPLGARLIVSVSRTEATLAQVRRLRELARELVEVRLALDELSAGSERRGREVGRGAQRAERALGDGHNVLLGIGAVGGERGSGTGDGGRDELGARGSGTGDGDRGVLGARGEAGTASARATSRLINRSVAEAAALVVAVRPPAAIVANGGDCALALCGALGIQALAVERALGPGVVVQSDAQRLSRPPVTLITKSGGFGGAGALAELCATSRREPAGSAPA